MKRLALALLACSTAGLAQTPDPAAALRDAALGDTIAWDISEGLTTEVGPRLAASPEEARARDWAVAKLKALGFANVRIEPFEMPAWTRGEESAEILAPFPQKLAIAALGASAGTPAAGVTTEVVGFDSLAALQAAPDAAVKGRIVFVTHAMARQQDGGSYGQVGAIRRTGPGVAAQKGAAAILIKSIGTDSHRLPHTGVTEWPEGVKPIPAAALSVPDADQLSRILARGKPVKLKLALGAKTVARARSGNVVAEVPGRDPSAGIVLIGGHLDSWDQGTGAIDDASGLAIVTAAAKRIMDAGQPLRTIRIVWFGAEEVGGDGGEAYVKVHGADRHALVAESDFGAGRVWRFQTSGIDPKSPAMLRLGALLAPLGITRGGGAAHGGADVGPAATRTGAAVIDLNQDGTDYFDLHHTPDDTLDKIDPAALRQNVAAWTAMLAVLANEPAGLGK